MVHVPGNKTPWIEYRVVRLHRPSHENWSLFATIRVPGYTWMFDCESFRDEEEAVARLNAIADAHGIPDEARRRRSPLAVHYW